MAIEVKNLDLQNEPTPFQNDQAYKQKNHNWAVLRNSWTSVAEQIDQALNGYDIRMANMIHSVAQPNEVVDARVDAYGKKYNLPKDRLDADQLAGVTTVDSSEYGMPNAESDISEILQIKDLTSTSAKLKYQIIKDGLKVQLPMCGLEITTLSKIEVDEA